MLFDRGTFWVLPLTYFCLPKRSRACLFPQPVKIYYFCSGPISADPICPQPFDSTQLRTFAYPSIVPPHTCMPSYEAP